MSVFVNYAGPKLDKKQNQLVRLAPAPDQDTPTEVSEEAAEQAQHALVSPPTTRSSRLALNRRCERDGIIVPGLAARGYRPDPYDLRGAPPKSTHMTGIDARTFQDYLSRCASYSSYLDEAFILVGFQQPSYFRPDMSKSACIYIGWLLTAGVLDAVRASKEISYPYYEYQAVRELQKFIDGAGTRDLHELVYPVIILGMFEMVRFNPHAATHLGAVEHFIKSRGGLKKMPDVMQHLVIMGDVLECVCLGTPLAFNNLGPCPTIRLKTTVGVLAGNHIYSCPLLLCDDEDFSLATRYVDQAIVVQLVRVLQAASDSFHRFFGLGTQSPFQGLDLATDLDAIADSPTATTNTSGLFLKTCALAARITRRTLSESLNGFDDVANKFDVLEIYDNARFLGLKAWKGLPYVYVWVNLIGFAASTGERMRSYFVAEVVRCAFSYGCYQMEIFLAVLRNFLHLRNTVASRKIDLA
ncbi:hypothetical protein SAPIO_CDS3803 [Scedosporium apiospermum]|uniref:Transcription factor domain-containing protein n=1 Tax=Pseudallescheria apiosperma TaxID=563466 RepID=A0A084G9P8_PSEDA|nr:uncharacterized protein SAPIO_CDS3803 [Scedosporium apiospermum]KEZ44060.1 hypothetical protein SAPIO_CDS3803 [Scedosporium apiospermum]